jgi:hypothetical protein
MRKYTETAFLGIAAAILAVMLVLSPTVGLAIDTSVDCLEKPEFEDEPQMGYYIWRDKDDVWHVVTVTKEIMTLFAGEILVTRGEIEELTLKDEKKRGEDDVVLNDNRVIEFNYMTDEEQLEFEFTVTGDAPCVNFDLKINKKRERQNIFLGERKVNPRKLPFARCY